MFYFTVSVIEQMVSACYSKILKT